MAETGRTTTPHGERGFTLIEMVIVIVIAGIIASVTAGFIATAMRGYLDQDRRATLVDIADTALTRVTRDVRRALPNSVRVADNAGGSGRVTCNQPGQVCTVEFLDVVDGGRYRAKPPGPALPFNRSSATFDVLGGLYNLPTPYKVGNGSAACLQGTAWCLVIYNVGQPAAPPVTSGKSANAYLGPGNAAAGYVGDIATVSAISGTPPDQTVTFDNSDLDSGSYHWHFPLRSPQQRFYIVDGPVSYVCDPASGTLRRYWGYPINAGQPVNPAAVPLAGTTSALLADHVKSCFFDYRPGTSSRSGLLTVTLAISEAGETVALFQQAHVVNAP